MNNFAAYNDNYQDNPDEIEKRAYEITYMTPLQQEKFIQMVNDPDNFVHSQMNLTKFTLTKHMCFLNFEQFSQINPIYINFVRNPVERIISWYYYERQPMKQLQANEEGVIELAPEVFTQISPSHMKMSFEDCVELQEPTCQYNQGQKLHNRNGIGLGGSHLSQVCIIGLSLIHI